MPGGFTSRATALKTLHGLWRILPRLSSHRRAPRAGHRLTVHSTE
jgi:hypothetical protein